MGKKKQNELTNESFWAGADAAGRAKLLCKVLPDKPMDETKLKKLLETADEQDQVKLKVLYNAVIKGVNEYNKNSSQIKLKNWKSAEKELAAYIDILWAKYIDHERVFTNLLSVIKYLKDLNWKVSKSLAYKHKEDGKIKSQPNGTYRQSDVDKYAATHLKMTDGSKPADALSKLAEEKAQAELDKTREQLEHLKIRNQAARGMLVPKDTFERELAQRAIIFKADDESFCRAKAPEIVALVGGDKERIPDLIEFMLAESAKKLNRYAADREFIVPAAAPEEILQETDKDLDEDG